MTDVVSLFCTLVQIDSPTGEEHALAQFLVDWMAIHCHLSAQIDQAGNVFVRQTGTGDSIFLSAHMDTVEPGRGVQPVQKDGWIHSDGTTILGADNKNAVATLLVALEWHASQPESSRRPLEVLFTVEEEANNTGAVAFDRSFLSAKEGFMFDATLPVGTIINAAPFYARFDATVQGKAAHAGYREQALPALNPALDVLQAIEHLRTSEVLVNIGKLSGGTARNTIIGDITFSGEIRTYKQALLDQAITSLTRICNNAVLPIALEVVIENPGYIHETEALKRVQTLFSHTLGRDVQVQTSYGCSDANIFNTTFSVFCCGSGELEPHTVRERVRIADLHDLVSLWKALMQP